MDEKLISLNNLNTFKSNLIESTNGSIDVTNEEGKKIDIGIKISEEEGNAIEVKDDGIYSGSADGLVECDPVPYPVYRERKIYKTPYGEYKLYTGKGETYYESWELGDVRYANGTTFPNTTLTEEIARWRNEVVGSYIKATSGGDGKVLLKIETVADTGQLYYGTTNIGILVQGGPNVIYNGAGDIYSNVVFGPKKMAAVYAKEVQLATKDDLMDIDIDTTNLVKKENLTDKSISTLKVKVDGGDLTIGGDAIATNTSSDFFIGGQNTDLYLKGNTVNLESNGGSINIETKSSDDIVLNSNNEIVIGTTGSPINIGNGTEALYMEGAGATLDIDSQIDIKPQNTNPVNITANDVVIGKSTTNTANLLHIKADDSSGYHSIESQSRDIQLKVGDNFLRLETSYFGLNAGDGPDATGKVWIDGDGWLIGQANEQLRLDIVQNDTANTARNVLIADWESQDDGGRQYTTINAKDDLNLNGSSINLTGAVKVNGAPLQVGTWQEVHSGRISGGKQYKFDISSKVNLYSQMCIFITDDDSDNPYIQAMETYDLQILRSYIGLVYIEDSNYGHLPLYQRYTLSNGKFLQYGYALKPVYDDETFGKMCVEAFGSSSYDTSAGKDNPYEFGDQYIKVFMR